MVTFSLGKGRITFINHLSPVQVVDLIKSKKCMEVTDLVHDQKLISVLTWLSAKGKINPYIDVRQWDDEVEFSFLFSELRLALNQYTVAPEFREWINGYFVESEAEMDNYVRLWRTNNRLTERKFSKPVSITRRTLKDMNFKRDEIPSGAHLVERTSSSLSKGGHYVRKD
jgi:hypothetical protein